MYIQDFMKRIYHYLHKIYNSSTSCPSRVGLPILKTVFPLLCIFCPSRDFQSDAHTSSHRLEPVLSIAANQEASSTPTTQASRERLVTTTIWIQTTALQSCDTWPLTLLWDSFEHGMHHISQSLCCVILAAQRNIKFVWFLWSLQLSG